MLFSFGLKAGKSEKGYEALHIYDYFKAKSIFNKLLKNEKPEAAFGLALIYRRTDNPFHNLDSAVKYGALANYFFKKSKKVFNYKNFKVDSSGIQLFCDTLAIFYLKKIEVKNEVKVYEHFLINNAHINPTILKSAFQLRDEALLEKMVTLNNSDSTLALIQQYPQHYLFKEAQLVYEKQVYEQSTKSRTEQAFKSYLLKHPHTSQTAKAQEELFTIYSHSKNKEGLDYFVKTFPKARQTPEAWKLLFGLTVSSYSNEQLQNFLTTYPEFPFKTSILKEITLNNYILLPVELGELSGFIDTTSKLAIAPQFDKVNPFSEGLALVTKGDSVFYINKENQNVFNRYFSDGYDFNSGVAAVQQANKWFFINRQGQTLSALYDDVSELSNGVYVVKLNDKYGALDKYAQVIIEPRFSKIGDYKNDLAYYEENGVFGFIDKVGTVSKPQFQWISDFNEYGVAIMQINNKYGLTNPFNQIILEPNYDQILNAGKNIYVVVKNNKYGYYTGKSCFLSGVEYDFKKEKTADYYTNGQVLRLLKKDQQAFMDGNGKVSIDFGTYDELSFANNGLIKVKRKNKYGFVNRKLNLVIPYKYSEASDFKDSLAIVKRKNKTYLINLTGNEILETEHTLTYLVKGYFKLETEEDTQLLNTLGRAIFTNISEIKVTKEGYLIIYFKDTSIKVFKY